MAHSVKVIINGVNPSDSIPAILLMSGFIHFNLNLKILFFEKKKAIIQMKDRLCESTVARLAPFTPISKTNIKRGSSAMLTTAPISTENIAVSE